MSAPGTTGEPSLWVPESDLMRLAVLGKAGEETCELGARLFRSIIQGFDATDPTTGKTNRDLVQEEVSDVTAQLAEIVEHFELNPDQIAERCAAKRAYLHKWHAALKAYVVFRGLGDRHEAALKRLAAGARGVTRGAFSGQFAGLKSRLDAQGITVPDFGKVTRVWLEESGKLPDIEAEGKPTLDATPRYSPTPWTINSGHEHSVPVGLPADKEIEVLFRSGRTMRANAGGFAWKHGAGEADLIRWRRIVS